MVREIVVVVNPCMLFTTDGTDDDLRDNILSLASFSWYDRCFHPLFLEEQVFFLLGRFGMLHDVGVLCDVGALHGVSTLVIKVDWLLGDQNAQKVVVA